MSEAASWLAVAAVMNALYAYGAVSRRDDLFGIAVAGLSISGYLVGAAIVAAGAVALYGIAMRSSALGRPQPGFLPAVAAVIAFPIFWRFRTNVLNPDGNFFTPKFEADVPRLGAHVTHDEMLELFVHSRFWDYTHRWWGWSVVLSYQVLSTVAGLVFVLVVFRLARRLAPESPSLFLAGILGGGYMQLFFGDVENYTITSVLILLYLWTAWRFLDGVLPLSIPSAALGLAMCFHLEAGWLGPSWLYLCAVSARRTASWQASLRSGTVMAVMLAITALGLQFVGLPLIRFFSSHAGHALQPGRGMFALGMPWIYWRDQLNVLVLLCPSILMLVPLVVWRRIELDEHGMFLVLAAASTMVFHAVWKSQIGVYNDWNLYAINGLMISILLWRAVAHAARTTALRIAALVVAATAWLHTFSWILTNHLHAG